MCMSLLLCSQVQAACVGTANLSFAVHSLTAFPDFRCPQAHLFEVLPGVHVCQIEKDAGGSAAMLSLCCHAPCSRRVLQPHTLTAHQAQLLLSQLYASFVLHSLTVQAAAWTSCACTAS